MNESQSKVQLFNPAPEQSGAMVQVASSKAAQEVQAAMVIAKKFPRDQNAAFNRIIQACKRKTLAEEACYAYPRGGTTVTGPSIRLAEVLAQNWGNMDFGIIELEQRNGESTVMAYAWDLETNARSSKVFQVLHERKAQGQIKKLEDPRDIYELVANQGARRLRAAILSVIPGDITEEAVNECERTLASKDGAEPMADRVRKMTIIFAEFGVTIPMLEKRLGHRLDACIEQELVTLRKIYKSIKDGAASREDFFEVKIEGPKMNADAKAEADAGLAPSQHKTAPTNTATTATSPVPAQDAPKPAPSISNVPTPDAKPTTAAKADAPFDPRELLRRQLTEHGIVGDQFIAYAVSEGMIKTPPPTDVEDRFGTALLIVHGKIISRLSREINTVAPDIAARFPKTPEAGTAPQPADGSQPAPGPHSTLTAAQAELLSKCEAAGVAPGAFIQWANEQGHTNEVGEFSEIPDTICGILNKAWNIIAQQLKAA